MIDAYLEWELRPKDIWYLIKPTLKRVDQQIHMFVGHILNCSSKWRQNC